MIWNIITDSSSDLYGLDVGVGEDEIRFSSVPFSLSVGDQEFIDDEHLSVGDMLTAMEASKEACRSSCPAPGVWAEAFEAEGSILALTISKNLSGSYNSACSAQHMMAEEHPDKKIAVVDSLATGPALIILARRMVENIRAGKSFEEIVEAAERDARACKTIFALCSFDNLVKNGRMPRMIGFIAQKLGLWGIGIASAEGTIIMKDKVRGVRKVVAGIVKDMQERGLPTARLVITHCMNPEAAEMVVAEAKKLLDAVSIEVLPTRGLDGFYAERGGLIITYL